VSGQVMAIATLVECFDNPRVFTGVVKIRKGLAARLILVTVTPRSAHATIPTARSLQTRVHQLTTPHSLPQDSGTIGGVHVWFHRLASVVAQRCPSDDPSRDKILRSTDAIIGITQSRAASRVRSEMCLKAGILLCVGAVGWAAALGPAVGVW